MTELTDEQLSRLIACYLEPDVSIADSKCWRITRNPSEMSAAALDCGADCEEVPRNMLEPEMTLMLMRRAAVDTGFSIIMHVDPSGLAMVDGLGIEAVYNGRLERAVAEAFALAHNLIPAKPEGVL